MDHGPKIALLDLAKLEPSSRGLQRTDSPAGRLRAQLTVST
jgi:hypothetical protein